MHIEPESTEPYGLIAEFDGPDQVLEAARKIHKAGYRRTEAYTPFPVHGLARALGMRGTILPWLVLVGGIAGGLAGYGLQYWVNVIEYPINIGGRPNHSWPAFIPVTFECTILGAALTAVLGMLGLNGLPRPHHPVFNVEGFSMASTDRFFLMIRSVDPLYDAVETEKFLLEQNPLNVKFIQP